MASNIPVPRPCLKWAGGKRELIKIIDKKGYIPEVIDTYYEPFFGAGAVFFHLYRTGRIHKAIISDLNFELINVYNNIKENIEDLIEFSKSYNLAIDEKTYYMNRNRFNDLKQSNKSDDYLERAVLMMYLNKTAYSGMYRENKAGFFNVPFGNYPNPTIIDEQNLREIHNSFENVTIIHGDFDRIVRSHPPSSEDFVYMDPPYMPCKGISEFRSYLKNGFDEDEQLRVSRLYKDLTIAKIKTMVSNSSSDKIAKMYESEEDTFILSINAKRYISIKTKGLTSVKEFLIMNYTKEE